MYKIGKITPAGIVWEFTVRSMATAQLVVRELDKVEPEWCYALNDRRTEIDDLTR